MPFLYDYSFEPQEACLWVVYEATSRLYFELRRSRKVLSNSIIWRWLRGSMPIIFATKQQEGEFIKAFIGSFKNVALRRPIGMTQITLIVTCQYNLQPLLLVQTGVVECCIWKQLVQHGEQAEKIVVRVRTEVGESMPKLKRPPKKAP